MVQKKLNQHSHKFLPLQHIHLHNKLSWLFVMLSIRPSGRPSSGRYFEVSQWLKFMQLPTKVRCLQLLILLSDRCCTRARSHLLKILLKALFLACVHVFSKSLPLSFFSSEISGGDQLVNLGC